MPWNGVVAILLTPLSRVASPRVAEARATTPFTKLWNSQRACDQPKIFIFTLCIIEAVEHHKFQHCIIEHEKSIYIYIYEIRNGEQYPLNQGDCQHQVR